MEIGWRGHPKARRRLTPQLRAAIRRSRRLPLIEAAVAQATDAVVITTAELDPPGPRIVYTNPSFSAMTGYAADELLGRSPRLLHGPATDRAVLDQVRSALEHGRTFQGEVINYRKDGQAYRVRWHMAPIRNSAGAPTHWVAIQRDISAETAAAAERVALFECAQEALRLRDDFLSVIAHELRTPITALRGYTELLRGAASGERPLHELARFGTLVAQQTERLTAVITELLDGERIYAGTLPLAQQPVDLVALSLEVAEAFRTVLPPTHTLRVEVPPAALLTVGDELRLRHVIEELLANALAFSPQGGTITVTLSRQGELIELAVQDMGIGIPEAAVPRVWERFYRASNVDQLRLPGLGVGLFSVHEIVRRHGGSVDVHSRQGVGSTVRVRLPIQPPAGRGA